MHSNALKEFKKLALMDHPVAKLVVESIEVGVVVPSILKTKLEGAGYKVGEKKLKHLYRVEVSTLMPPTDGETTSPGPQIVAKGTSDSPADALLQAIYAYLREIKGGV